MKNILITGSRGLLGNNLKNLLISNNNINLITPNSSELNLLNTAEVDNFFDTYEIDSVIHCASLVGGILYNIKHQYEMAVMNSLINMNILNNCVNKNIERLLQSAVLAVIPSMHNNRSKKLPMGLDNMNQPILIMHYQRS